MSSSDLHDLQLRTRREKRVPGKPEWIMNADVDGDGAREILSATNSPGALLLWREPHARHETIEVGDFPLRPVALVSADSRRELVAVASRATRDVKLLDLSRPSEPGTLWTEAFDDVPMVMTAGELDASRGQELFVVTSDGSLARGALDGSWTTQPSGESMPRCALVMGPELGLVIGFQSADTLDVFVASANGSLERRARHSLPGTARDLLSLDVDGDGDEELIVVEGDHGGWVLGVGVNDPFDASAAPVPFHTTAIPIRLLPFSQDGPGNWAVLAAKSVAAEFWSWKDSAPKRRLFSYAGQTPMDFTLRDADDDGRPDLWIANRDAHRVSLLRLAPDGPLQPFKTHVGAFPNDIATGDLDGDGLDEVFVINAKDNDISVLARNAKGALVARERVRTGPSPRAVLCGDVDQDGNRDLLWLAREPSGTRLHLKLGDGALGLKEPAGFKSLELGVGCRDMLLETFPGEPRAVLVATDQDGRKLLWTRASREGGKLAFETAMEMSLPGPPRALATLRFKGVARGIVVGVQLAVDRSMVLLYTPSVGADGSLSWDVQAKIELAGAVIDLATGDLDGDGIDDVSYLASDREGAIQGRFQPLLVKGARFEIAGSFPTGLLPQRILARDFSGNGLADVFVANLDSHNVNAWLTLSNDGAAPSFKTLDDVGAGVGCIALGSLDFEGDGDEDLLVVDSANDGVSLILNERR